MPKTYADIQRDQNPLAYEQARLAVDAVTELRIAMDDLGLNMSDLARRMGRSRSIICRQLSGGENLTLAKLSELAFALGRRVEVKLSKLSSGRVGESRRSSEQGSYRWPRLERPRLCVLSPAATAEGPVSKHQMAA